jgi:hypothetical protein
MLAVAAMMLLGAGLTAAGTLWSGLYDIGILTLIVAAVGFVVRVGDALRIRLNRRADPAKMDTATRPVVRDEQEQPNRRLRARGTA